MTNRILNYRKQTRNLFTLEPITIGLIGAWLLTMIGLPIAVWIYGDEVIPIAINIAAVFQASAVFYIVKQQIGLTHTLKLFTLIAILGLVAEAMGHRTGFPFGDYHYTDLLQPQILGVPALIPIAWFMLMPPVWALAQIIVSDYAKNWHRRILFAGVSAIALTAWDLFLDPQMVNWGFWQWAEPSGYFGIPWSNYAGWLLVAFTMTLLANPPEFKPMPLVIIYGIVWFLQSVGLGVFWGQIGPAVIGCLAMGSIMLIAYWRYQQRLS